MKSLFGSFAVVAGQYGARICLLACSAFVSSCQRAKPQERPELAELGPARGDTVVLEQNAAQFIAGRVLTHAAGLLRVQKADDGASVEVRSSDAYRLPGRGEPQARASLVICQLPEGRWVGCRVEAWSAQAVTVTDAEGGRHQVAVANVLLPTELTKLNLERHFARGRERQRFMRELEQSKIVQSPGDWRPKPHEHVLASSGGRWYSAKVRELGRDRVYVIWQADGRLTELPRAGVVPEPPYEFVPRRGGYCMVRPSSPAEPWQGVRIETVLSTERVLVSGPDGQTREVSCRDLVPLG